MQVKTVREHGNSYGDTFEKSVGDTYAVPDGTARQTLINEKLVEAVAEKPAKATDKT